MSSWEGEGAATPSAGRQEVRILGLRARARFAEDDTAVGERGRPGPGLAGVAKREDSYGPKSGPKAGSRASSPGEQAAACDYRKTRLLGCCARDLNPEFNQAGDVGVIGAVRTQVVRVEVDRAEAGGAGAADVVADRVADVYRPGGLDPERLERVAEDLSGRLFDTNQVGIDDRQHGHAK